MRRVTRLGIAAWSIVSLAGCAAIAGLDQLQKADGGLTADAPPDAPDDRTSDVIEGATGDTRLDVTDAPGDAVDATADACAGGLVQHNDGLGHPFCDDVPAGTYNLKLATDACAAFTGDVTQCDVNATSGYTCSGLDGGPTGETLVCSDGAAQKVCDCWSFTDPGKGQVTQSLTKTCSCNPSATTYN